MVDAYPWGGERLPQPRSTRAALPSRENCGKHDSPRIAMGRHGRCLGRPTMKTNRVVESKWAALSMVIVCGLLLGGCAPADPEDPAATLGDEEWSDDGPPAGEGAESV